MGITLREITAQVIEHHKSQTGKGPRKIRVSIMGNVMILCMEGALTVLEQTLVEWSENNKDVVFNIRKQLIKRALSEFVPILREKTNNEQFELKDFSLTLDHENDIHIGTFIFNLPLPIENGSEEGRMAWT